MQLDRLALIACAGAIGALSRYGMQTGFNHIVGRPSVIGTLIVNLTGSFLLGLIIALTEDRFLTTGPWRTVIAVGFLGSYTTFSTLMLESVSRLEGHLIFGGLLYLTASFVLGLVAVYAGLQLGRAV